LKSVKFITTFSRYGYLVYGKKWIDSFLSQTKNYENISATIYIDNMHQSEIDKLSIKNKLQILNYNTEIPQHNLWLETFERVSKHNNHVKTLCKKFSFKSFVIFNSLEKINSGYVIWLDADCIFQNSNFEQFPQNILDNKFIACQIEKGTNHVESGFIAFDAEHQDKKIFVDKMKSFYLDESKINSFGELYDGFVIYRTLNNTRIDKVDLNRDYGLGGVQSDPNRTFLNPEIGDRFYHNIGITGKRNYDDWKSYAKYDEFFRAIHGIDSSELGIQKIDKVKKINNRVREIAVRKK